MAGSTLVVTGTGAAVAQDRSAFPVSVDAPGAVLATLTIPVPVDE
ncbi:hypothetical protein [Cellulomonas aerilata]|nr:hypothetical protein [Cellulomonas aerilata]